MRRYVWPSCVPRNGQGPHQGPQEGRHGGPQRGPLDQNSAPVALSNLAEPSRCLYTLSSTISQQQKCCCDISLAAVSSPQRTLGVYVHPISPAKYRKRLLLLFFLLVCGSSSSNSTAEESPEETSIISRRHWKGPKLVLPSKMQQGDIEPFRRGLLGSLGEESLPANEDHGARGLPRFSDSILAANVSEKIQSVSEALQQGKERQLGTARIADGGGDTGGEASASVMRGVVSDFGSKEIEKHGSPSRHEHARKRIDRETPASRRNLKGALAAGLADMSMGTPQMQKDASLRPTTEEARRLAQHLLYRVLPNDPTFHVLIKFSGVPTTPARLARALPLSISRLWCRILQRSFPSSHARWAQHRIASVSTPGQRLRINNRRRRGAEVLDEAAGWFVSAHRVTLLGFCFSEEGHRGNACSGHIAAGFDAASVQRLLGMLLENEAMANFQISGLGDLRRVAMLGKQHELAAQRVVRLLLSEASLLFRDHNSMASVLMVAPQSPSSPVSSWGSSDLDGSRSPSFRSVEILPPFSSRSLAAGSRASEQTPCETGDCRGGCKGAAPLRTGGGYEVPAHHAAGGRGVCTAQAPLDRNVHMLIEMSGQGPGLDIRSFPSQIVQLITAEEGDSTAMNYFPQEDYSPHDSIILNSSSGEIPLPTKKYIDPSRIILQGTCRRVVSATGTSTLLKTREFGIHLSPHQRRSVEMQLPESRILVHIEILGVPRNQLPIGPFPAVTSVAYFTGPHFLSEHKEEEPYTAAEAATVIRQRISDQFRHVWGNARVVLSEVTGSSEEETAQGAAHEDGQPGKSDYQTWKILVAVLVPSFIVGALVVAAWHSTSICKCGGSSAGRQEDTSAARPSSAETHAETKDISPTQTESAW